MDSHDFVGPRKIVRGHIYLWEYLFEHKLNEFSEMHTICYACFEVLSCLLIEINSFFLLCFLATSMKHIIGKKYYSYNQSKYNIVWINLSDILY